MRFLLGVPAALVVAACSGASSTDLFGGDPRVVVEADASATEPAPVQRDAAPPVTKDASADVVSADATADAPHEEDQKCDFDSDCADGTVCNWKSDVCAAPGDVGDPCKRDLECTGGLCNWKLTECSDPAPAGTACRRNKECASGACSAASTCK